MGINREINNTLPKILCANVQKYGEKKILMSHKRFGLWNAYTWKQVYENTELVFLGLKSMGMETGDVVGIIGDNDPRWFWAEYATQCARGITIGMYIDYHYEEVKYVLGFSKAKYAFAKDQEMVDKILHVKEDLPHLKKVIYWEEKGLWFYDYPWLMSYDELQGLGREYKLEHPELFERSIDETRPDDPACVMLSSGTTRMTEDGVPRSQMAVMTHASIIDNLFGIFEYDPWLDTDEWVSYMSPAWGEQYFGICGPLLSGAEICFPESPETVDADIRERAPEALIYPSVVWENKMSEITKSINNARWINKFIFKKSLSIGNKMVDATKGGNNQIPIWLKIVWKICYWTVYRHLHDNLGLKNIRHAYNAGSLLAPELARFFLAIGITLKQLYGTTETGLNCIHPDDEIDYETVGKILYPDNLKISDDEEILLKGSVLACTYLNDEEAWKENFDEDGWFHTGDAGRINKRGHLIFYDRFKDLIHLKTGKAFSPQYIEARLKFSSWIGNCIVIGGEDKDFVSVIIIIDYNIVGQWAEDRHIGYTTFVDLSQKPQVYKLIREAIEDINKNLDDEVQIKKFVNLHREFDADDAEITRSGKIRRKFLEERYQDLIDFMYSGGKEYEVTASVKYKDGRVGQIRATVQVEKIEM